MTETERLSYIGGVPILCDCGAVLLKKRAGSGFRTCDKDEGVLYVKCKRCKKVIGIRADRP